MEAFVGALIGTVVQFVADQVNSLLKEKLNEGGEFNEDLVELKNNFTMIKGILHDAAMQQITSVAVTRWLKKLEDAAFEADNALDEFNYHLLRQKAHTSGKRKKDSSSTILGRKIKGINQKLDLINRQATSRGIHQKLIAGTEVCSGASASRETDSFTLDPIFIGRDDDVSKIVEILTTPTEEAVSILPIVGMGGLGKTALARKVFNNEKTKAYFDQHIWVHVSQSFDAVNLLKKIFTNLNIECTDCRSKEVLLKGLQEALGFKTYLLVLDDVWNEDWQKWEEFSKSWSGIIRTKGNRIIVTTRSTEVGSLVKTLDTHLLSGLSDEQCWSIIKDRAFEGGDIPPELEVSGRSIAGRCKGLPLAANVVGKMLRGRSQDEWCSIEKEWLSVVGGDENYISKVLKLSYHHLLSPILKKCFAYCSIFPKGSSIDTKKLIELWMAEGFLQTSDDMENVGNQFLKVLLHNSLLQVVDRDEYGNAKSCSMHDLVHDVARSVLDFPSVNDNEARYIRWTRHVNKSSCIPKDQAKWLRTLFYEVGSPDIIFWHFESLHALTLKLDFTHSLNSISELIHLRYLHILGAHHRCLPNSIGELYQLQTLRAKPEKLPSTLTRLINLRHLHVPFHTELPPHLGRLTSLRTLPYFHVRNQNGHRISELGSLKYLKGELMIDNLEKVQGEEDSKKADLSQKSGIIRLALSWSVNGESREGDKNVLNGLQPHTSLMILEIAGFKGASFPLWTSKMAVCVEGHWVGLNNLVEIKLSDCVESEEIPSMGHLPRLKSLYLYSLEKVKSIGSSFYGIDNCKETVGVFPALERLELWDMKNFTEWEEVEIPSGSQVKIFPSLAYLKIRKCKQLRCAPSQFTCLKYLIVDEMESGLPLVNICDNKLKTLTELKIGNLDGLTCLPTLLFYNNQHLSMLEIMDCPNLIQLPGGMHRLNSLHELNLQGCNSLRSIPYSISGEMKSLHRLSIWGCPKLTDFPVGMVESCAPLLKELRIDIGDSDSWHCESFKKTVDGVLRLGSQSLGRLELRGKDWESLPDQLQHLTSLSKLHLTGFGIKKLPEWFANLSSLSKLKLSHCKKLECLPSVETMRRLTSLSLLLIDNSPLLDADSEWPKICHLPNVTIDGQLIPRRPSRIFHRKLHSFCAVHANADHIWRAMIKDYVQAASVVNLE